jgi:cob(I)alamin adenosyltransferase
MIPNQLIRERVPLSFHPIALPRYSATAYLGATVKIYTKTGDGGETSLFGGGRAAKSHQRVAAYGDVDELNAAIGVVAAADPRDLEAELLRETQRDLLAIGSLLASPDPDRISKSLDKATLTEARVAALETAIDRLDAGLPELRAFILPGGTHKAALFHWARVVCRRAERSVVELNASEQVPAVILAYLNRLSDLLFVLARSANDRANVSDREW